MGFEVLATGLERVDARVAAAVNVLLEASVAIDVRDAVMSLLEVVESIEEILVSIAAKCLCIDAESTQGTTMAFGRS